MFRFIRMSLVVDCVCQILLAVPVVRIGTFVPYLVSIHVIEVLSDFSCFPNPSLASVLHHSQDTDIIEGHLTVSLAR